MFRILDTFDDSGKKSDTVSLQGRILEEKTVKTPRNSLLRLFDAALCSVRGDAAVRRALAETPVDGAPLRLLAMGKAAVSMARGAADVLEDRLRDGLVITRHGYGGSVPSRLRLLEAGHPVPDAGSLGAGEAALSAVAGLPEGWLLLALISGGASALVEVLPQGMTLEDLQRLNRWLLGSGLSIHQVNRIRQTLSLIKGGRLAARLGSRPAEVLLISDVPGDDPALIASGPFHAPPATPLPAALPAWIEALLARHAQPFPEVPAISHRIVASNRLAREAAAQACRDFPVFQHEAPLQGEAESMARRIVAELAQAPAGLHLWGGETTVTLPPHPGRGGRNQHLALAAALAIAGRRDLWLLAAGTDGSDGNSDAAGALVDGETVRRGEAEGLSARDCLRRADAGAFLAASGDLIDTGPTGTNVMDLVLALKIPV